LLCFIATCRSTIVIIANLLILSIFVFFQFMKKIVINRLYYVQ